MSAAKRPRTAHSYASTQEPKTLSAVATLLAQACGASPAGMETLLTALASVSGDASPPTTATRSHTTSSSSTAVPYSSSSNGSKARHAEEDVRIPSSCVGWLKGKQGGMIREIENRSGARIDIDQETKDVGYCTVHISGYADQRSLAHGFVVAEVMKVIQGTIEEYEWKHIGTKEEFSISGQYVGWIKGPKGHVVKDLTSRSGTRIDIDQPSREGDATIRVFGTYEGVQNAKRMIATELSKVSSEAAYEICSDYLDYPKDSKEGPVAGTGYSVILDEPYYSSTSAMSGATYPEGAVDTSTNGHSMSVDIPNSCVGWLKGKQGAMIRDIESMSGAQVSIDQTTKDAGYAQVRITGSSSHMKTAQGLVVAEVMKVIHNSEERADWGYIGAALELVVSAQYVGWLKGPKGKVVRDLTMRSATRIDIDQTSRESLGLAVVKVFGTHDGVEEARRLIAAELSKVSPEEAATIAGSTLV